MPMISRQVRDGIPILLGKYNPHNTLKELLQQRELAMAKRHVAHHEAWSEHTNRPDKKCFCTEPSSSKP